MSTETIKDQRNWQDFNHSERIDVKRMSESIKPMYYVELDEPDEGHNGINIHTFFNQILDQYCDIG